MARQRLHSYVIPGTNKSHIPPPHFYHIPLVRNKAQVLPTLKGRGLQKGMETRGRTMEATLKSVHHISSGSSNVGWFLNLSLSFMVVTLEEYSLVLLQNILNCVCLMFPHQTEVMDFQQEYHRRNMPFLLHQMKTYMILMLYYLLYYDSLDHMVKVVSTGFVH